ncbi:hypothetical protein [Flavobacterium sp. C4GT6]|uniref:hypothetical protein n=1 Tax=Flavobacterium sp. C4GT6 TaxID=3103818 RepID=UPI002ED16255
MKKTFLFAAIAFAGITFFSCSNESISEQPSNSFNLKTTVETVEIDSAYVITESKNAMISFVEGVTPYYHEGMTFNDFKWSLDPASGLEKIKAEGSDLLKKSFSILNKESSIEDATGIEIMRATEAMIQHNIDLGHKTIDEVDLDKDSFWLFGLDPNSVQEDTSFLKKKGCKWYQIGCHISNVWEWLSSTANGGGASNGVTLAAVVTIVSGILVLLL